MATNPMPYTFGTATSAIPLSQLDTNFATPITLGNTAVYLNNTYSSIGNLSLANVTITSGTVAITNVSVTTANVSGTANISTLVVVGNETVGGNTTVGGNVTLSGGTANGVAYLNTSKALTTGSALVFDGTNLGVGITPTTKLHVSSASNTFATVESTNGAAYWQMIGNNATNASYNSLISKYGATTDWSISGGNGTTGQMLFNIGSTEGFRLTSTSLYTASGINVGIGTSSPAGKLHVVGAQNAWSQVIAGNTTSAQSYGMRIQAGTTSADTSLLIRDATNVNDYLAVIGNGNVGIGTSSPNQTGFTAPVLSITNGTSGILELIGTQTADGTIGQIAFYNTSSSVRIAQILGVRSGANNSGALTFQTNNAGTLGEAGRFDPSGNLLVGTTSTSLTAGTGIKLQPTGQNATTPGLSQVGTSSANTENTLHVYSTGAAAYRFYVGYGGTIFATSIVITAISDARLKENVRDIDTGLSSIMELKPRRFDWKEGKGQDKKNVAGFIAQEFETVFPECVSTSKAGADGIEYKNINHETLIPTLVKAIQELKAEIDSLKSQLNGA